MLKFLSEKVVSEGKDKLVVFELNVCLELVFKSKHTIHKQLSKFKPVGINSALPRALNIFRLFQSKLMPSFTTFALLIFGNPNLKFMPRYKLRCSQGL